MTHAEEFENFVGGEEQDDDLCRRCNDWPCLCNAEEECSITEETCECGIDYGQVVNDFGQSVCEHCQKESREVCGADS